METACLGKIAGERGLNKAGHFRGNFVGRDGDQAVATEGNERERQRVVARENEEIFGHEIEDGAHLGNVPGGFLEADDVFNLREAEDGGRIDIYAGAALNTVEDDGQIDGGSDGFEVLEEAFLRGLVVVGSDGEDAVGAELLQFIRESDDFGGVVATGAGEDGNFALGDFEG